MSKIRRVQLPRRVHAQTVFDGVGRRLGLNFVCRVRGVVAVGGDAQASERFGGLKFLLLGEVGEGSPHRHEAWRVYRLEDVLHLILILRVERKRNIEEKVRGYYRVLRNIEQSKGRYVERCGQVVVFLGQGDVEYAHVIRADYDGMLSFPQIAKWVLGILG